MRIAGFLMSTGRFLTCTAVTRSEANGSPDIADTGTSSTVAFNFSAPSGTNSVNRRRSAVSTTIPPPADTSLSALRAPRTGAPTTIGLAGAVSHAAVGGATGAFS